MIRRLNYTGRGRIKQEHVQISLIYDDDHASPIFDAEFNLDEYALPADARILVEVSRHATWQRFDFGTVGKPQRPEDRRLTLFGSAEGVKFRVKIVEPSSDDHDARPARILSQADRIRPRASDHRRARSLLPLDAGDFRDEVWRLEIDETGGPLLKISRHLAPNYRDLAESREFATLALPAILRAILTRIIVIDQQVVNEDSSDWRWLWIRLATSLPGVSTPPPADGRPEQEEWIENAVAAFCRRKEMSGRFRNWWNSEE